MTTRVTITIDNETITPAECEALWLDFDRGTFAQDIADERGTTLVHASALIFAGEKIYKGEVA